MRSVVVARVLALAACWICAPAHCGGPYGLGRAATAEEIRAWDIDVRADGAGLPPGQGSVAQGTLVFAQKCAACHGNRGQGGPMDKLTGGNASLASPIPIKTIGSYWPYATTLFDYVRRAMPFNAPQSLSSDETYAVVAYVLHLNGIVAGDATLDANSLPAIAMPNRDGFIGDPRPDVKASACESGCR
ncbi:MAG TPA: cytochrome c [Burkholderiales bacterium]|nr:cytochrome c [Burkholderiales bacterium]